MERLHFVQLKVFLVWMIDNLYHLLHERKPILKVHCNKCTWDGITYLVQ